MEASAAVVTRAAIRGDASLDVELVAQIVRDGGELVPEVPAICVAANFGAVAVVERLVAAGADANATYRREPFVGWTALHFAGLAGDALAASTAAALVTAGASTDARTPDGLLPVDVAGGDDVRAALRAAGSPPRGAPGLFERSASAVFMSMMGTVAALRPSEAAEALLTSGRPREMMRWADPAGRTALHVAAFAGSPQLCAWCLDNGAEVDARDLVGTTALRETLAAYLNVVATAADVPNKWAALDACMPGAWVVFTKGILPRAPAHRAPLPALEALGSGRR